MHELCGTGNGIIGIKINLIFAIFVVRRSITIKTQLKPQIKTNEITPPIKW